ncbi:MAG TPA: ATP-binding protein [Chloroflexi bacterium]|nr:MAG: abortive infection protein [Anaerolineaceae bacterium 4572_5.2]HEY84361.1 ATP-binding protein [Chloroflexota bacterium]
MLIEFSVGNFRSFKEVATFSMLAAKLRAKNKELDANNVFYLTDSLALLKSGAVYGANASGKSNLVQAIAFMRKFVLGSSKDTQVTEAINVEPFKLNTETEESPTYFEIVFYHNNTRYRYGFTADREKIHTEWLYHVPSKIETKLFIREDDEFDLSTVFKEGKGLESRTRNNALFLSVVAQFNGKISQNILLWFTRLGIVSGLNDREYRHITIDMLKDKKTRQGIISLVKQLDTGISDIIIETRDLPETDLYPDMRKKLQRLLPDGAQVKTVDVTATTIATLHKKYDEENQFVSNESFSIEAHESKGTQKIFYLSGPLLHTLQTGKILIIDELDARFHPLITAAIIRLFNAKATNPHNAQLVFTTHDTNLLDNRYFRRDQIWFTEKDKYGATDLYSLAEYRVRIRNDASFEKDYISGKYGAVPFIGNLESFLAGHPDG